MANILIDIDGQNAYSDGTYIPSDCVSGDNCIINIQIDNGSTEKILRAVADISANDVIDFDDLQEYSSSYAISVNSEWVTVIRERNVTRLLFSPNYDEYGRECDIIVTHTAAQETYCMVHVAQDGNEYTLDTSVDTLNFGVNPDTQTVMVTCTGGSCEYMVHKVRKYTKYTYSDTGESVPYEITKRVTFDNAISVFKDGDTVTVCSYGSFILDDSYYEITFEHMDMPGLKKTITIEVESASETQLPDIEVAEVNCPEEDKLPIDISTPDNEETITPSIESRDSEIVVNSDDYSPEIIITTVPQESQIYFTFTGTFIDDYIITDYVDENDNITHGLRIKAKPNPFGVMRYCVGYVINAMYPQVKMELQIRQY